MTKSEFDEICMECVNEVMRNSPIDTGNLRYNAIQFVWISETKFQIYVNEDVAEYMPYTNEPWLSDKWRDKKNPNEGWWQDAFNAVVKLLIKRLKGKIVDDKS